MIEVESLERLALGCDELVLLFRCERDTGIGFAAWKLTYIETGSDLVHEVTATSLSELLDPDAGRPRHGGSGMIFCRTTNCTPVDAFWTNFIFWWVIGSVMIGTALTIWQIGFHDKFSPYHFRIDSPVEALGYWLFATVFWPLYAIGVLFWETNRKRRE